MFKRTKIKTITDTVIIKTPLDFGEVQEEDIDVTFKKLSTSEFLELNNELNGKDEHMLDDDELINVLAENITQIEGIRDEDNQPVEYNREVFEDLMDMPHVRLALIKAFFSIQLNGKAEVNAKTKNSRKRANSGQKRK